MKYIELHNLEINRKKDDLYLIHFYLNGDWWRAYEWSAYLVSLLQKDFEKENSLKVNRKICNGIDNGITFVGLKLSSFDKYFPNVKDKKTQDSEIIIDCKDLIDETIDYESYHEILNNWKNTISFAKEKIKDAKDEKQIKNEKINDNLNNKDKNSSLNAILNKIANYDIINHTLLENTVFINEIKILIYKDFILNG